MPTIENDQEQMKKMNVQPPLSSAYLEGGPSKKRKVRSRFFVNFFCHSFFPPCFAWGCQQLESGEAEPVPVSEILGETLQSAIDKSGTKPVSDASVEGLVNIIDFFVLFNFLVKFLIFFFFLYSFFLLSPSL